MLSPSFEFPPSGLKLMADEIHIWAAVLGQAESRLDEFIQMLSSDERVRAEKFFFERDRRRFIVRRGILRAILGLYLDIEPRRVAFLYGRNGKPEQADAFEKESVHFNVSDSDGISLFAFTRDREIGVDIEHIRDIPEMEQIAERFFSIKENEVLRTLPWSQKREAFFSCWTCKEAFIKALGEGLSLPLDKFDVSLTPGALAKLLSIEGDSREASRWSVHNFKPAPDYLGSFAVKSHRFETKRWRWEAK
jgi:4'-phosphopantetheinyl transferase